jgi:hypothetical protein
LGVWGSGAAPNTQFSGFTNFNDQFPVDNVSMLPSGVTIHSWQADDFSAIDQADPFYEANAFRCFQGFRKSF